MATLINKKCNLEKSQLVVIEKRKKLSPRFTVTQKYFNKYKASKRNKCEIINTSFFSVVVLMNFYTVCLTCCG